MAEKVTTRLLVRGPNYLGDHVMALPFYASVRQHFSDAHITLLAPENLTSLVPLGFDAVLALQEPERRFARDRLRAERFDLAITLPASFSSAFMLFSAGIPKRYGFTEMFGYPFLTKGKIWKGVYSGLHKRDLYLELLKGLGIPKTSSPGSFAGIDRDGRRVDGGEKVVVIAPGASISLREWPYFPELVSALANGFPEMRFVVVGAPNERKWTEKFAGAAVADRIGKTSLIELAKLCSSASLVIANDSGVAHLAATVSKAPTLVLFGPGNPDYIKPSGSRVQAARIELDCSPCESAKCRIREVKRCLNELPMAQVLAAANEMLNHLDGGS